MPVPPSPHFIEDCYKKKSMYDDLIEAAKEARMRAYAPYSKFLVGAAILTRSGKMFLGCNVENSSYGAAICAERVAVGNAYAQGEREFAAIAIVADAPAPCPPCGICRQVLFEVGEEMEVILTNLRGDVRVYRMRDLLPDAFSQNFLT